MKEQHVKLTVTFFIAILLMSCVSSKQPKKWAWTDNLAFNDTAVFAPGIISLENRTEQSIAFSNDGNTVYFSVLEGRKAGRNFWVMMQSEYKNGIWQHPIQCEFSGHYSDYGPYFSPDGNSLYFTSKRPVNEQDTLAKADYDIWKIEKKNGGWSNPKRLATSINTDNEEHSISVSDTHLTICASSNDTVHLSDFFMIKRTEEFNNNSKIERLGNPPNSLMWEGQSFIDPHEKYILFSYTDTSETANEDIYISYKNKNKWTTPKKLNSLINTEANEYMHCLSPDGKFIFFGRNGQIYMAEFSKSL
jgi:Tol biopolymer transport system component